ncbi:hypothetical protein V5799_027199 [Amblyomma americanum]|uniref:Uncharacterized protein n=1 Tax=Amblyomma americanum TaxID=6943 RepID=A0AAQ4DGE4_AMBAM
MSSPSPGESEDTTAFCFAEVIGRNIRRGRKTGVTPRDFDLSSLESPSLTAAVPVFPELPSPQKVTRASAEDNISKEPRTSHQEFPKVLPTLRTSAGLYLLGLLRAACGRINRRCRWFPKPLNDDSSGV